jgi:hypothetical protein
MFSLFRSQGHHVVCSLACVGVGGWEVLRARGFNFNFF